MSEKVIVVKGSDVVRDSTKTSLITSKRTYEICSSDLLCVSSNLDVGHKDDYGKPRLELVEPDFLTGLAEVIGYGAQKYGEGNWKKGLNPGRFYGALLRHANAFWSGEVYDKDTGLHHMLHVAVNAMFIHWYSTNTSGGGSKQGQTQKHEEDKV
ncbi:MAG: DUF5664 domain-containing protein [Nitrososphaerota archaeon]|jgi:hypothetical protein|nr:DUF5664 domain-containing protein [Nitrososphaerota archaeon]